MSIVKAKRIVGSITKKDIDNEKARSKKWWNSYFDKTTISIPDKQLENFYYIQMYKLATCSNPNGPAMDNFGTFFKMSQWPGMWWNLNVQLAYSSVYANNRLEQGENYVKLIDYFFNTLVSNTSVKNAGNLAWALHNYYLHLRYAGMDWHSLWDKLQPKLKVMIDKYKDNLKEENGVIHLLQTDSPEYYLEYKIYDDSNYNLACLRWLLMTYINISDKLSVKTPDYDYCKTVINRLASPPTNKDGLMIGRNAALKHSHRHYSHLLSIYPLHVLDTNIKENKELAVKSIEYWNKLENGQSLAGYSYTGAAALYATMGDGNNAYKYLNHFLNEPLGISLLLPNTMYVESGGKNVTVETPLNAAALADMLIQSWNDAIKVFKFRK